LLLGLGWLSRARLQFRDVAKICLLGSGVLVTAKFHPWFGVVEEGCFERLGGNVSQHVRL